MDLPFRALGLLAGALLLSMLQSGSAQTTLRWKLSPGQRISYQQTNKTQVEMAFGKKANAVHVMSMDWLVGKVEADGIAAITQTIGAMRLDIDAARKMHFDSQQGTKLSGPLGVAVNPVLDTMVGSKLTARISPLGEVSDLVESAQVRAQLQKSSSLALVGSLFSDDAVQQLTSERLIRFPTSAVNSGESWQRETTIKQEYGTMVGTTIYTYKGPTTQGGKNREKIAFTRKLKLKPDADASVRSAEQTASGEVLFDNQAGCLSQLTLKQEMSLRVAVLGTEQERTMVMDLKLEQSPKP